MIKTIQKYPLYLFLLPVFFVLHGFAENFGFIDIKEAGLLLLSYLFLTLSIAGFSYFFFRNWNRASLITTFWISFFFFFGAIHDFMKQHSPIHLFTRYSFLLVAALSILFILFIFFKRSTKPFQRFSIYLNALFLIYILIDLGVIFWKITRKNDNRLSTYGFARQNQYKVCDTCSKPDIYFLLYDEYGSSLSLKEQYNFNNDLDSFLIDRKFSVQTKSRSNYNFTAFSMSATLNMSFIEGIKNTKAVTADDYANCNLLIRDNEVIKFLDAHGYDIVNYSVFDLAGHPAMVEQSFLPLKTKLISDRTLFAHLNKDIGWLLITRWPFRLFSSNHYMKHKENNKSFQQLVVDASNEKLKRPRFIYTHFYMPHPPYFFDRHGNTKDEAVVYHEFKTNPPASYLEYVIYVNSEIKKLITSIQQNSPSAVIVILSDHGYRELKSVNYPTFFKNMNAVYFPDKDYTTIYDSITNVNEFRVILNKYFRQSFPLLKDSTILLIDK
jgi:hypothetical protein